MISLHSGSVRMCVDTFLGALFSQQFSCHRSPYDIASNGVIPKINFSFDKRRSYQEKAERRRDMCSVLCCLDCVCAFTIIIIKLSVKELVR